MYRGYIYFLVISCLIFFTGCSNTRYLPKGEKLYTGHTAVIKNDTTKRVEAKSLRSDLEGLLRPLPNTKFLGVRLKLWLYNIAGKPKKPRGLRNILKTRLGEPPVLASSVNVQKNAEILQNRLENRGYFQAVVRGDTIGRGNRKLRAKYTAQTGIQYMINAVNFPGGTGELEQAIAGTAEKSLLKAGEAYNLDVIKGERTRIDQSLKQQGFYFFGPDYIIAQVDSTIGEHKVNLYINVKPAAPEKARLVYKIGDIYIYPNYSLKKTTADTSKANAVFFDKFYVIDKENTFRPNVFSRSLFFKPGDVYNRKEHNLALNRLVNLGSFKFVNNRFEMDATSDSARLDAYYYLTPSPRKSFRGEISGTTKSNNQTGSQINFSWRNRNTFGGAEQLSITGYTGIETQVSGTQRGYGTVRFGGEGTLSLPHFLIPILKVNTHDEFVPRSKLILGYEYLTRRKLYDMTSFRGSLGYEWKSSVLKQHELYIANVNYAQPSKITQQYQDSIDNNPTLAPSLRKAIEQQFIIGSTYSFLFNNQPEIARNNHVYFNATVDVSGNIPGLLSGANAKKGDFYTLFGSRFSQYIRVDGDFRYYFKLGLRSQLVNRVFTGFGFPYGNSTELPFIKQYFTGGSSTNRAFRSRSVGPGTFRPANASLRDFLPEQSGDIKLELNTEYRTKLTGIVNGAVFVDAGNIWLYNENPEKPGAKFSKDFFKELAAGTGVGLRFDITFLVIRTDLAFPIRKPWLPAGQRWVLNQVNFGDRNWRRENLVFNLAIGYPF